MRQLRTYTHEKLAAGSTSLFGLMEQLQNDREQLRMLTRLQAEQIKKLRRRLIYAQGRAHVRSPRGK